MDNALHLLHTRPQNLTVSQRAQILAQCKVLAFQSEASQVLDSVRDAGTPGFKVGKAAQRRLKNFLDWTGPSEKISNLKHSAPGVFMILGLCLSNRDVVRSKDGMFDEVLRQARLIDPEVTPHLVNHSEILKVVNSSSNNMFKARFEALREEQSIAASRISSIFVNGIYYYHYVAPTQPKLEPLIRLSFNGTVAVYLPELDIDGVLKITTAWDVVFLEKLFLFNKEAEYDAAGFTSCAYVTLVAHCLGQDIFNAMNASITRALDNQDPLTNCVKCQAFPGQVIIVEVTISKAECKNILTYMG
ncbi:hypothetical protein FLAG1_09495 [Fusarium langsethiae]|uniref:Uncharacterized protein n=1 Tax=Fusarium langsethiae TaxID=179993 RepID=A0A0M9EQQ6_FUSLA|nr:hypothetical protein FLAG1_09495 [Fusarium langsethiae]